eukprot:scaffold13191_cov178-Amphora_coffeaeformis.AAC.3
MSVRVSGVNATQCKNKNDPPPFRSTQIPTSKSLFSDVLIRVVQQYDALVLKFPNGVISSAPTLCKKQYGGLVPGLGSRRQQEQFPNFITAMAHERVTNRDDDLIDCHIDVSSIGSEGTRCLIILSGSTIVLLLLMRRYCSALSS